MTNVKRLLLKFVGTIQNVNDRWHRLYRKAAKTASRTVLSKCQMCQCSCDVRFGELRNLFTLKYAKRWKKWRNNTQNNDTVTFHRHINDTWGTSTSFILVPFASIVFDTNTNGHAFVVGHIVAISVQSENTCTTSTYVHFVIQSCVFSSFSR